MPTCEDGDHRAAEAKCDDLQTQLLDQVPADAEGFVPLAKAYGIPKDDPNRRRDPGGGHHHRLRRCPCTSWSCAARRWTAIAVFADEGLPAGSLRRRLRRRDRCKAALQAASLNVFINTKTLQNRAVAEEMNAKCLVHAETIRQAWRTKFSRPSRPASLR